MWMKALIVFLLLVIIASMASAMFYLVRDKGQSDRTLKALTLRIGLSVAVFVLLLLGYATGLITPHGVYPPPPTP